MTIKNVRQLVTLLDQFQLLEPAQLGWLKGVTDSADPRVLAQDLLRRNWLTPYQVNHLFRGQGAELIVGPYIVLRRIGEGGSGQIFQARHRYMRRLVALKVIRSELLTDAELVNRFLREMRIASQLSHPNVVHAYDAGPVGSTYFLAMEYVEGIDFTRLVGKLGPLPVAQACNYLQQAARGLAYAHARGLVHRDIKPPNFLVSSVGPPAPSPAGGTGDSWTALAGADAPWGLVKLLDLGLARLQRPVIGEMTNLLTPAGPIMLGTPDYMAPEQAIDFHLADHRADIYSLGCTGYFLLTGHPPFPGGSLAQKLLRHQQARPKPISCFRSDAPVELERILLRMMAKQPEERSQSAAEVVRALQQVIATAISQRGIPQAIPVSSPGYSPAHYSWAGTNPGFHARPEGSVSLSARLVDFWLAAKEALGLTPLSCGEERNHVPQQR
jgi:serine/threonine-protein kinase